MQCSLGTFSPPDARTQLRAGLQDTPHRDDRTETVGRGKLRNWVTSSLSSLFFISNQFDTRPSEEMEKKFKVPPDSSVFQRTCAMAFAHASRL